MDFTVPQAVRETLRDVPGGVGSYWGKRIYKAANRGYFSPRDKAKASSWVTCACGKHVREIPTDHRGIPRNPELKDLGRDFYYHVKKDDPEAAASTLVKIENLVAQLAENSRAKEARRLV